MSRLLLKGIDIFLDVLLPRTCCFCQSKLHTPDELTVGACRSCSLSLTRSKSDHIPFHAGGEGARAWSVLVYDEASRSIILGLKYQKKDLFARTLGRWMAAVVNAGVDSTLPYVVVPVPVTPRKFRLRGYNQSSLLGKSIAKSLGITPSYKTLKRIRDDGPLGHLGPEQRKSRVKGAFTCRSPESVTGKTVLLVDDVMTTSATLAECGKVLISAGARRVDAVVAVRVEHNTGG